jgi:mono/diheme cytochrome c family protein
MALNLQSPSEEPKGFIGRRPNSRSRVRLGYGVFCILVSYLVCNRNGLLAQSTDEAKTTQHAIRFERDVQPIFQMHCYACHGPSIQRSAYRLDDRSIAMNGGDSGDRPIVANRPDESLILQYVQRTSENSAMPPDDSDVSPLSDPQIAILKAWIEQGATWSIGDEADNDDAAGTSQADREWWSLQPLTQPTLFPIDRHSIESNPIDAFISHKLKEHGLQFSEPADAATLLRRVSFGLTGLPQAPETIRHFQDQYDDTAYINMVNSLLDSPRYGERWARHWLDVVRFAESGGFETNQPRPGAWRYRDYVIQAFNRDLPYDQFVREQIAGDAFGADVATGFIVGGAWDEVKSPDPVLTAQQRSDELHDMVSTTGSVFLGLTVGCARCHKHKFDPISQVDYFSMVACLAGVQHGERAIPIESADNHAELLENVVRRIETVHQEMDNLVPLSSEVSVASRRSLNSQRNVDRILPVSTSFVRFEIMSTTTGDEPCIDELELWSTDGRNAALNASLTSSGNYAGSLKHQLQHVNDGKFGNDFSWISNTGGHGWVTLSLAKPETIDRIVWGRDRLQQFTDRTATRYSISFSSDHENWTVVSSSLDRSEGFCEATAVYERDGSFLTERDRILALKLQAELLELEKQRNQLTLPQMAYAGRLEQPSATYRLSRGDPMQPKERVSPAGIVAVGRSFTLDPNSLERDRRIQLAQWISDPDNPLTARVLVNRLWQYHFGVGIVDTPSDFGRNGGIPTHPELLDWLASQLIANRWSIKHIQRLIVTSKTYRQSSAMNMQGQTHDASNRLYWRFAPRRLEAEALRDTILAVAGQLDLRMGGPGFDLFVANTNYVKVYETKTEFTPEDFRRMIYQNKPRVELDSLFGAFDCPDASSIQPKRNVSTTPLQALNLLNSDFVIEQSGRFAERVIAEAGQDQVWQIRRAFELALGRIPSGSEQKNAMQLVQEHGIKSLCRALLNSNEFISVR